MPFKPTLLLICGALLAACAGTAPPSAPQPVVAPTTSLEQAERKLARAAAERKEIEAAYVRAEQVCFTRFMVNTCLDAAKEKRRGGLAGLRAIEVEAERYKRQVAADQRDRELAQSEQEFREQEARAAAAPSKPARGLAEPAPPKAGDAASRAAANQARLKRIEAQEKANAAKRAASVAAFEKRRQESEERQREVEAKRAEKAEKAAKDAAAKQE